MKKKRFNLITHRIAETKQYEIQSQIFFPRGTAGRGSIMTVVHKAMYCDVYYYIIRVYGTIRMKSAHFNRKTLNVRTHIYVLRIIFVL